MKLIENYLNDQEFDKLKNVLLSEHFPWFFCEKAVNELDVSHPQFFHNFFLDHLTSPYFSILLPILKKINPLAINRIKANSTLITSTVIETGLHPDLNIDEKGFTSALYFVNTCDGYCRIGNEKIYSKENSMLFFNSSVIHTGTTCTNAARRVVINMIYR